MGTVRPLGNTGSSFSRPWGNTSKMRPGSEPHVRFGAREVASVQVILFRHGPAGEPNPQSWPDDRDRPLSEAGERHVGRAAAGLRRLVPQIGGLVSSPARRARGTAEILGSTLGFVPPIPEWPELGPGGSAEPILGRLVQAVSGALPWILVGHEPPLSEVAGLATCAKARSVVLVGRSGAVSLDFEVEIRPGGARIAWAMTASLLEDIGRGPAAQPAL